MTFIMSVCLPIHMKQLGSHWMDFHEILYFEYFFFKYVKKIQVSLKSDNNNGYLTRRPTYIYGNFLPNSS